MLEQQPKEPVATGLHLALLEVNSITPTLNFGDKTGPNEVKPGTIKLLGVLHPTSTGEECGPHGINTD